MDTSNKSILIELIQEAFATQVLDQFGRVMEEAYLLNNWTTNEGYLVNGIAPDGLIYEAEDQERTLYQWSLLHESTLQNVLMHLQEESFA